MPSSFAAIVDARRLGLDVVVEGIERSSQLDHVHAPYAQGYLMHRPMVLDTLLDVLRDNRSISAALSLEPPRDATLSWR